MPVSPKDHNFSWNKHLSNLGHQTPTAIPGSEAMKQITQFSAQENISISRHRNSLPTDIDSIHKSCRTATSTLGLFQAKKSSKMLFDHQNCLQDYHIYQIIYKLNSFKFNLSKSISQFTQMSCISSICHKPSLRTTPHRFKHIRNIYSNTFIPSTAM